MLTAWPYHFRSLWRSLRAAAAASRFVGRAEKLGRAGRNQEALAVARRGLDLLREAGASGQRHVAVVRPAVQSTHAVLTTQVEQFAHQLNEPGAGQQDLAEAAAFLRALPEKPHERPLCLKAEWLPYLERRLAMLSEGQR